MNVDCKKIVTNDEISCDGWLTVPPTPNPSYCPEIAQAICEAVAFISIEATCNAICDFITGGLGIGGPCELACKAYYDTGLYVTKGCEEIANRLCAQYGHGNE